MSTIYFFRHGQAGRRDHYDCLSDLGREQADLLGQWLHDEGLHFDRIVTGGLRRQCETAEAACASLDSAPPLETDERWNEFDLDEVYRGIAPRLAAADPQFRLEHEEVGRLVAGGDDGVHRRWTAADAKVVQAWMAGRFDYGGESWFQFAARVQEGGKALAAIEHAARVAVFTSATPVAIWVARVFGNRDPLQIMRLAGAALNTNVTILHWRDGDPHLFWFNAVPHLPAGPLRTFR